MLLLQILIATLVAGVASGLGAAVLLAFPERLGARLMPPLVSVATGALLGAALLALLPEAIDASGPGSGGRLGAALLAGFALFFTIEKLILWRHAHRHDADPAAQGSDQGSGPAAAARAASGQLVLVGDLLHNGLDGLVLGAAWMSDASLGLVTTIAVAAHEIPHRIGDFVILLDAGLERRRALKLNLATGLAAPVGGLLAWLGLGRAAAWQPEALALAAAGFLYIAMAGLVPGLERRTTPLTSLHQGLWMAAGAAVIALTEGLAHRT